MIDRRALTPREALDIEKNIYSGCYSEQDLFRLCETVLIYRRVIRKLFAYFKKEPLRRVSIADPVNNSELAYLRELASLDDSAEGG